MVVDICLPDSHTVKYGRPGQSADMVIDGATVGPFRDH